MNETISTALTTAFSAVQTDVTSAIGTALPYALGIMGLVLAISIVVRVFKRFAN